MTLISTDPRYLLVMGDRERERLFNDYIDQRVRREREDARKRRRDGMENFRQFLEASSAVTVDTQWRTFKEQCADDPIFTDIDKLDSLNVFMEYIKELEVKEVERLKQEKLERRTRSRKCREAFRRLLDEQWVAKKINVKTRWKQFKPLIKNDTRYLDMLEEDIEGSTPAELFYDLIEDREDRYHKDRKKVKEMLKTAQITIDVRISYEMFVESIKSQESFQLVDETNLKYIYQDLHDKALKAEEKTKKKAKKRFAQILRNTKITRTTTWDQIKTHLPTTPNISYLPLDEKERKQIFDEHLKKRALDDDFDSSSDDEEGIIHERRRSQKKDRRRESRSSTSSVTKKKKRTQFFR